jgi:hypothetical protein
MNNNILDLRLKRRTLPPIVIRFRLKSPGGERLGLFFLNRLRAPYQNQLITPRYPASTRPPQAKPGKPKLMNVDKSYFAVLNHLTAADLPKYLRLIRYRQYQG